MRPIEIRKFLWRRCPCRCPIGQEYRHATCRRRGSRPRWNLGARALRRPARWRRGGAPGTCRSTSGNGARLQRRTASGGCVLRNAPGRARRGAARARCRRLRQRIATPPRRHRVAHRDMARRARLFPGTLLGRRRHRRTPDRAARGSGRPRVRGICAAHTHRDPSGAGRLRRHRQARRTCHRNCHAQRRPLRDGAGIQRAGRRAISIAPRRSSMRRMRART